MTGKRSSILLAVVACLILLFTLLPIITLVISAFNDSAYFNFPPEGLTLKWFGQIGESKEYQTALRVSATLALTAVSISLVAGVPAAFAIDRYDFPGKNVLQAIFLSPLMLPHIVWAIALVQYFAALRVIGTFPGLVLAHCVIVIPYVIRVVLSSLAFVDRDLESAAQSLGASPPRTFFEVTLPLVVPGVIVAAAFGFMISFTDVIIAVFIAGARNITFPVRMYSELRSEGLDPLAVAVSAVVVVGIVILAMIGEKTIHWSKYI
jgi:putative spermidine/putrescine transport system permease protein